MPIFPELADVFRIAFEQAEPGEELVLPMLKHRTDPSLRNVLVPAIQRAGLSRWPRLWQNLRASRQTDLESTYPSHVTCAWLGNSPKIARQHYLMVTENDFAKRRAHHRNRPEMR